MIPPRRMGCMGRMSRSGVALAVLALLALSSRAAEAAGFELQTLQTAPAGDRFLLTPDGGVAGDGVFYGRLFASYAYRPLLKSVTSTKTYETVSSQLYFDLGGAYAIGKRGLVGVNLPLVAYQGGNAPAGPDKTGLGDARLTGRVAIVSVPHLDFGTELRLWLPTGSTAALAGDGAFRSSLHVAASGGVSLMKYAMSVGFLTRKRQTLGDTEVGSALPFSVAVGIGLLDDRLFVGPELSGYTVLGGGAAFFGARTTPIVGLLGARYRVGSVVFGVAGGPGLTTAPGVAPRVVLSVGWEPPAPIDKPAEAAPDSTEKAAPAPDRQTPPPPPPPKSSEFDSTHMIPGAPPPPPPNAPPPAATPSGPPPSDDAIRDQARQLFRDGVVAYDAKNYAEAILDFDKAYKMKPHPIVLLNLAQSELKAGQLDLACQHFKTWKEGSGDATPAVLKQVKQGIKEACH